MHVIKGKEQLWQKLLLGYTKGFVGHVIMIVFERLDFTDFQRVDENHLSIELVFCRLPIKAIIHPFLANNK